MAKQGIFPFIRNLFRGKPASAPRGQQRSSNTVRAGGTLESTAHVQRNTIHWANAEDIPADAVASSLNRSIARGRCRYEYMNAGYIKNAVRAFKTHVVGAEGPKLKITPPKSHPLCPQISPEEKDLIEWEWYQWVKETENVGKLKHLIGALMYDGEAFLLSIYDPYIFPTEINYQEIEARRVERPFYGEMRENEIDGIEYDGLHPHLYYIERQTLNPNLPQELIYDPFPAKWIHHIANLDLIGQHRGLPMLQCVLQMQADVRNWVIYTLAAAEQAARGGNGFITTDKDAPLDVFDPDNPLEEFIQCTEPGMTRFLPPGAKPEIPDVKFPTQTFSDFNRAINGEIGAGVGVPGGVMMADTSAYNYSSYKGERQNYWTYIADIQQLLNHKILDRQFNQWFEAMSTRHKVFRDIFNRYGTRIGRLPREWKYAKPPSVDPLKDASAWKILKELGVMSEQMMCEELGTDYDDVQNDFEQSNRNAALRLIDQVAEIIQSKQQEDIRNIVNEAILSVKASGFAVPAVMDAQQQMEPAVNDPDIWKSLRDKSESIGAMIRAGVLTATPDIEAVLRQEAGLPAMSAKLLESWDATGNIRQPITLKEAESAAVDEALGVDEPPPDAVAADSGAVPEEDDPEIPPPRPAPSADELPLLLSAAQAGEKLNVTASQISGWRKAGLPYYRLGGRVKYSLKDLTEWISSASQSPSPTNHEPQTTSPAPGDSGRLEGEETVDVQ